MIKYCHEHGGISFFQEKLLTFDAFKQYEKYTDCNILRNNVSYIEKLCDDVDHTNVAHVEHDGKSYQFTLPRRMSRGIAENFILCAHVALQCGISYEMICEQLMDWQPANMRGNMIGKNGRHYFVDCYNANPAALVDSLSHFDNLFPYDHHDRIFVIGALDESVVGSDFFEENRTFSSGWRV